mmetsp:Transcript_18513/g.41241  ORF Transcript_18513/g.41241 Transcript_18513/m.41241 type:complete len:130 (+) Transcript_18513:84-473(+)
MARRSSTLTVLAVFVVAVCFLAPQVPSFSAPAKPKPEIVVKKMSKEEAEKEYGYSSWGTWGCGVSKFDWQYSGTETAYVLEGEVMVTPTKDWSSCQPTKVEAGDLVVFPDGMTCVWEVTKPIKKHFNFS